MAGQVISQSELTDLAEGSVILTILASVAEQFEATEFRLGVIRNSYDLDKAFGQELDERVADLPGDGITRHSASPASGSVLTLTRASSTGTLTVPAGSTFGRTDSPDIIYATVTPVVFNNGDSVVTGARVVCLRTGTSGNAPAGSINKLLSVPAGVIAVQQTSAIGGGTERETDGELRSRAKSYLSSLAQCQPEALRSVALNFVDSVGVRVRHAYVFEDLQRPAYSELIVDDGTGFEGYDSPGQEASGIVPLNGLLQLRHQAPATDFIRKIKVNGIVYEFTPDDNPVWVSYPERGIIQLRDEQTLLSPGDTWAVGDSETPYRVYGGYIAELQNIVEGSSSDPTTFPGKRAAGCQVRVLPPTTISVNVKVNLILKPGVVVTDAILATKSVIEEHFFSLGPGQIMYISDLYQRLENELSAFIEAVHILEPTSDYAPTSPKISLRAGTITVV
jgi:hypothetical protein